MGFHRRFLLRGHRRFHYRWAAGRAGTGGRRGQGWGPGDALLRSPSPGRGLTAGSCRCPGMVLCLRCSFFCLLPPKEPLPRARLSREALSSGSAPEAAGSPAGARGRTPGSQGSGHKDALRGCRLPARINLFSGYSGRLCERPVTAKA